MNEFDLQLESELRLILDLISVAPPPPRRGRRAQGASGVELRVLTPEKLATIPIEAFS